MATVRALEAGEAGSEVAATEEGLHGGDGGGVERAEGSAVVFFVTSEELVPTMVDDLPEGRGAGAVLRPIWDPIVKKCPEANFNIPLPRSPTHGGVPRKSVSSGSRSCCFPAVAEFSSSTNSALLTNSFEQ